jgi:hypothetical protein
MSTVQEIEAAIPRLSREELEQLYAWFEDYVEDHLELTDEVKARCQQSFLCQTLAGSQLPTS